MQQGFLHGAFILMFGVLLVKAIGALFKIPLSSIITEDGMGYFSTAYSFFNVLFSLSTVGFPVAVARHTAQAPTWRKVRRGFAPSAYKAVQNLPSAEHRERR